MPIITVIYYSGSDSYNSSSRSGSDGSGRTEAMVAVVSVLASTFARAEVGTAQVLPSLSLSSLSPFSLISVYRLEMTVSVDRALKLQQAQYVKHVSHSSATWCLRYSSAAYCDITEIALKYTESMDRNN